MFDFWQNPLTGTAQSYGDQGDTVYVNTSLGTLKCEALTDIVGGDVIVFKDKNNKYWVVGETAQTISEKTTEYFKSRPQPKEEEQGILETAVLFGELIEGEADYISMQLGGETRISGAFPEASSNPFRICFPADFPLSISDSPTTVEECLASSNTAPYRNYLGQIVPNRLGKTFVVTLFVKIGSISTPFKLRSYHWLQRVDILMHMDEENVYISLKEGNFAQEQSEQYQGLPEAYYNLFLAQQVSIIVINHRKKVKEVDLTYVAPVEIPYRNKNYPISNYAFNYITDSLVRDPETGEEINYYDVKSACDYNFQLLALIRMTTGIGRNAFNEREFNPYFEIKKGDAYYQENAPFRRSYYNQVKDRSYNSRWAFTGTQRAVVQNASDNFLFLAGL